MVIFTLWLRRTGRAVPHYTGSGSLEIWQCSATVARYHPIFFSITFHMLSEHANVELYGMKAVL